MPSLGVRSLWSRVRKEKKSKGEKKKRKSHLLKKLDPNSLKPTGNTKVV